MKGNRKKIKINDIYHLGCTSAGSMSHLLCLTLPQPAGTLLKTSTEGMRRLFVRMCSPEPGNRKLFSHSKAAAEAALTDNNKAVSDTLLHYSHSDLHSACPQEAEHNSPHSFLTLRQYLAWHVVNIKSPCTIGLDVSSMALQYIM